MRIDLAARLGEYISSGLPEWLKVKQETSLINPWFTPGFIDTATENIGTHFLAKEKLADWISSYKIEPRHSKKIGIVMAGIKHLIQKLNEWNSDTNEQVFFEEMLKGCDAYIATGSNNSSRYFEYYFSKYPHIIRRNRTSVAVVDGTETPEELEKLADDVHLYFGRGCRNVTKIFVPKDYDFIPLLSSFKKYNYFKDHNKYKNNYDYILALHILNRKFYMTTESIILLENSSIFSPVSQLNYEFYADKKAVDEQLISLENLQCAVGHGYIPFGQAQLPSLTDYADGIDTMKFLTNL